jgi:hypothetical protein
LAMTLTQRLPRTLAAMHHGVVDEHKARLIADAVFRLTDEHATAVETRVLDRAGDQTPGQPRAALAKAVLAVDPQGAEERRQEIKRERRVSSQPTEDGQAMLSIYHSAARIAMIHAALRGRAMQLRADPDDPAPWSRSRPTSPVICCWNAKKGYARCKCTSPCPLPPRMAKTTVPPTSTASPSPPTKHANGWPKPPPGGGCVRIP